MASIVVKQVRSTANQPYQHEKILRALGLRRIGHERQHKDNNCTRGMINKVKHLVSFELKAD